MLLLLCPIGSSQVASSQPAAAQEATQPPKDPLGRSTPRGTVFGFLNATRLNEMEIAVLYLDTPQQQGTEATALARQLAAVLNRYLPARLNEISDKPEGSIKDPRMTNEELIETIRTPNGDLNVIVQRIDRGEEGQIWLFSRKFLNSLPAFSRGANIHTVETHLPEFLVATRLLTIPLFEWLAVLLGIPLVYFLTGLLNRLLSWIVGAMRRRILRTVDLRNPSVLAVPIRFLLVALVIRWVLSIVELPLLARQIWSAIILLITITAGISVLVFLTGWVERYLVRRRSEMSGSASVLRLFRRLVDGVALLGALLFALHYFGVNISAALTGLGVGGIAIALAAQKTLENVIAGVSLIADQAVRVGDVVNLGDVQGTVVEVGLRSTRLRTVQRSLVSLPNGQMATMKLETLSARDKFLFQQLINLRYETTPVQLRSVTAGLHELLGGHVNVDSASVRVRFIRFGASSLEIEVFAYVFAGDWNNFLESQEELLHGIWNVVGRAGTTIALPSQKLYFDDTRSLAIGQNTEPSAVSSFSNARRRRSKSLSAESQRYSETDDQ